MRALQFQVIYQLVDIFSGMNGGVATKANNKKRRRHDHFPGGLSGFSTCLQGITIVVVCYYFYLVLPRESRSTAKAAAVDSSGGHAMKTTLFLSSSAVVDRENRHFDGH